MENYTNNEQIWLSEQFIIQAIPESGAASGADDTTLIGMGLIEHISLSESMSQIIRNLKTESISLSEESMQAQLKMVINEAISVMDSKHLRFNMTLLEPISIRLLDSLTEITNIYQYFNWLFNQPINDNFSFEKDDNTDGTPNDWTITNGTVSVDESGDRHHYANVTLNTNGEFKRTFDVTSIPTDREFHLYINTNTISGDVDLDINTYYDDFKLRQTYHYCFRTGDYTGWRDILVKIEAYTVPLFNKMELKFYGSNCQFYVDNFGIVDDYGSIRNPLTFEFGNANDNIEMKNLYSEKNIYLIPYKSNQKKTNINLYYSVLNKVQLDYLKGILNKKIIVRTSDRKIITGKLVSMDINYLSDTKKRVFEIGMKIEFF